MADDIGITPLPESGSGSSSSSQVKYLGTDGLATLIGHIKTSLASYASKPSSSTDNAIARYDGTNGALQNSVVTIADSGSLTIGGTWTSTSSSNPFISMGGYAKMTGNTAGAFTFSPSNTATYLMTSTEMRPISDKGGQVDLGSSSYKWRNLYLSGSAYIPSVTPASGVVLSFPTSASGTVALAGDIKDGTLTISVEGTQKATFSANQSGNASVNITASDLGLSSALKFIGTTTSSISDGSTTATITVGGESVTAQQGNVVLKSNKEFVWTGSAWEELGDESSHALKTVKVQAGTGLSGGGTLEQDRTISLSSATASTIGGIKLGSSTVVTANDNSYPLQVNSSGQGAVVVPEAGDSSAGIVSTDEQSFAGKKIFNDYIVVNDDNSDSDGLRPDSEFGQDDVDLYIYSTGFCVYNCDSEDSVSLSFPSHSGVLATAIEIEDLTEL